MIITYMVHEIVKNKTEAETIEVNYYNNDLASKDSIEGKHFDIPIHKRDYPSCYQYNVTIMLAKRLIKEDNRFHLDKKLLKRIFISEG